MCFLQSTYKLIHVNIMATLKFKLLCLFLTRDSSIRTNVQRVIKIWSKRSVLDTDFTDQLLAALVTNKPPERLRNKLLVEYKVSLKIHPC